MLVVTYADAELSGDLERLAELGDAGVADQIGVAGETDRRQPMLAEQVLDVGDLLVVGIAADCSVQPGTEVSSTTLEPGAGDAVERLFQRVGVIACWSMRRDGRPCELFPFRRNDALPACSTADVLRIEPDRARFERHVFASHALLPDEGNADERRLADVERRDCDLLAIDPGVHVVDHPGDVRRVLEPLVEVAIRFIAQDTRCGTGSRSGSVTQTLGRGDEVLVGLRLYRAKPDVVEPCAMLPCGTPTSVCLQPMRRTPEMSRAITPACGQASPG